MRVSGPSSSCSKYSQNLKLFLPNHSHLKQAALPDPVAGLEPGEYGDVVCAELDLAVQQAAGQLRQLVALPAVLSITLLCCQRRQSDFKT